MFFRLRAHDALQRRASARGPRAGKVTPGGRLPLGHAIAILGCAVWAIALVLRPACSNAAAPAVRWLDPPQPGSIWLPLLSGDGETVVAQYFACAEEPPSCMTASVAERVLVWDAAGAARPLEPGVWSQPADLSWDGAVVVGAGPDWTNRWTAESGWTDVLNQPLVIFDARAVSADGTRTAGRLCDADPCRWRPALWSAEQGLHELGLDLDDHTGRADGISADGAVVVGVVVDPTGRARPVRWVHAGETELLDPDSLLPRDGEALAVSSDGGTVVGWADQDFGGWTQRRAFRWTAEHGIQRFDGEPDSELDWSSEAIAASHDGSVVVGTSLSSGAPNPRRAWVWSEPEGMRGLEGLLPDAGGELGDGEVAGYVDVSADGHRVVGVLDGAADRAFVLRIPEPPPAAASAVASIALGTAYARRRGRSRGGPANTRS